MGHPHSYLSKSLSIRAFFDRDVKKKLPRDVQLDVVKIIFRAIPKLLGF